MTGHDADDAGPAQRPVALHGRDDVRGIGQRRRGLEENERRGRLAGGV